MFSCSRYAPLAADTRPAARRGQQANLSADHTSLLTFSCSRYAPLTSYTRPTARRGPQANLNRRCCYVPCGILLFTVCVPNCRHWAHARRGPQANLSADHTSLLTFSCSRYAPPTADTGLTARRGPQANLSADHTSLLTFSCSRYAPPTADTGLTARRGQQANQSADASTDVLLLTVSPLRLKTLGPRQ